MSGSCACAGDLWCFLVGVVDVVTGVVDVDFHFVQLGIVFVVVFIS